MFNRHIFSIIFFLFMCTLNQSHAGEGIQLGATRVIYKSGDSMASIDVMNSEKIAYLIQSWVAKSTDSRIKEKTDFIITPPLFKLEQNSDNTVRIMYTGNSLPKDRESVFWLNVNAIPSTEKNNTNQLVISLKTQVKLFYRPDELKGDANSAYKDILFEEKNGLLVIKNPTPFAVSFQDILINGHSLAKTAMVLPFSSLEINKKVSAGQTIVWNAINDYGAHTPEEKANIKKYTK